MKRTGEMTLGIIGVILSAIMAGAGLFILSLKGNEAFQNGLQQAATESPSAVNVSDMTAAISGGVWILITASAIGLILGLIAVIMIKGNKKPKTAGGLFIAGALLMTVISVGVDWLPGLLFLIAGIMSFVRKPKVSASM